MGHVRTSVARQSSAASKLRSAGAALFALLVLTQCRPPSIEYVAVSRSNTYAGPGPEVSYVATSGYVDLTYTLDGLSGQNVYFVLTNTNPYTAASNPVLGDATTAPRAAAAPARRQAAPPAALTRTPAHVQLFNERPPGLGGRTSRGAAGRAATPQPPQRSVSMGTTQSFNDDNGAPIAGPVTAQAVVTASTSQGEVTLIVWVDNACWSDTDPTDGKVTPDKVSALVGKFLLAGADNDIYDWVTNIYGAPWGPHSVPGLISPTSPQEINILLYDIDGDGIPSFGESRTIGFFYSRDNYLKTSQPASNQMLMFYIDAPLFALRAGASWSITGSWPSVVVSTLAHEFQHMINFYQKNVLKGAFSETWLNEMASMVTEDLVADRLGVEGPRGVSPAAGTAGSSPNTAGRLPYFNYYDDVSVTMWNASDALRSYSVDYAFGAYLARNFGGPLFFRNIVQSDKGGYAAIDSALGGYGLGFADALRSWGAAVLLSQDTAPPSHMQYNRGNWFSTTLDGLTYNLGSIDLYNYLYQYTLDGSPGSQQGPYIYHPGDGWAYPGFAPAANLYYQAATALTGTDPMTWHIRLDSGVMLTVVVKP